MLKRSRIGKQAGRESAPGGACARACAAVVEGLEGRRMLSVAAGVGGVEGVLSRVVPVALTADASGVAGGVGGWGGGGVSRIVPVGVVSRWVDTLRAVATKKVRVGPVADGPGVSSIATVVPPALAGALTGKVVYLTGGHGLSAAAGVDGAYSTDRGLTNGMVEDFGNQDQLQSFADYVLRAGGTVAALRPIGTQANEVVVDNDSAGASFTGSWSNTTTGLHYDEDYGAVADSVRFRFATTNTTSETAWATYTPTIPTTGFYPVYTWATAGTNRAVQRYVVNHAGGATVVNVDHRDVGGGWVYLGTYYFESGSNAATGSVRISNLSSTSGAVVISDAIRFGNGMGDYNPGTGISGRPREDEAGLYWILRSLGVGSTSSTRAVSYYDTGTDSSANISAQPRFAAEMNQSSFGDAVYISFHSNAGGGRGAVALWNNPTTGNGGTTNQQRLATLLGKELNEDMRSVDDFMPEGTWSTRTSYVYDDPSIGYGEISDDNTLNEFDATIVENAFHDDATDAAFLKSPTGRDWMARATVQGLVRYFNQFGGTPLEFAPGAPTNVRVVSAANGNMTVSWAAPAADAVNANRDVNTGPNGYAAAAYDVMVSRDGYSYAPAVRGVTATSYTFTAAELDASPYYFRIVATNAGGSSPMSSAAGGRKNGASGGGTGSNRILIVDGFDRDDSGLSPIVPASIVFNPPSVGTAQQITRVRPRLSNSFDYVVQAGGAIAAYTTGGAALGFDSASNEAVVAGQVNLSGYQTVIWLSGEESTFDETFSSAEQSLVSAYVGGGGRLFVSGGEIGWDLDGSGSASTSDRTFYNGSLKTDYVADDAGTYIVSPAGGGIFAGLSNISFDSRTTIYDANSPDVIAPASGSGAVTALTYVGGVGGGAAVQWSDAGGGGGGRVVSFGFPFETIASASDRSAVMGRVLEFFGTPTTGVSPTPGVPDLAAGSDTGVSATDDLTRLNNSGPGAVLSFTVTGTVAGATVRLFSGATEIGSAVAAGTVTTVTTDGTVTLSDGVRIITATQQESGKLVSSASAALSVTIDTAAPGVTAGSVNGGSIGGGQRSKVTTLGVSFSEAVVPVVDAFETVRRGDGVMATTAWSNASGNGRDFALTFAAGTGVEGTSLADGIWDLTVVAGRVVDRAGNAMAAPWVLTLHRLFGDTDGNRTVNSTDVSNFTPQFGTTLATAGGGFAWWLDFDDNGAINNLDLLRLRARLGVVYVY